MWVTPSGRCFLKNDPGFIAIRSKALWSLITSRLIGSDCSLHQPPGWDSLPFWEDQILNNSTGDKTQFCSLRSDFLEPASVFGRLLFMHQTPSFPYLPWAPPREVWWGSQFFSPWVFDFNSWPFAVFNYWFHFSWGIYSTFGKYLNFEFF